MQVNALKNGKQLSNPAHIHVNNIAIGLHVKNELIFHIGKDSFTMELSATQSQLLSDILK